MESSTRQWLRKPIQVVVMLSFTCTAVILYMFKDNSTQNYQMFDDSAENLPIFVGNMSFHNYVSDSSRSTNGNYTFGNRFFYKKITFLERYKNPCWFRGNTLVCLPYFFLAGMPKCGTTDLFYNIVKHPSIEVVQKEPHWWTRGRYGQYIAPLSTYTRRFKEATKNIKRTHLLSNGKKQHIFGDGSASTLWDSRKLVNIPKVHSTDRDIPINLPDIIHHILPDAKIIVILRNPVERLYSDYLYFSKYSNISRETFHNRVNKTVSSMYKCMLENSERKCAYKFSLVSRGIVPVRLQVGMYELYLQDWLRLYRRDQLMVIKMEEYTLDKASHLKRIATFLGLEPYPAWVLAKVREAEKKNGRSIKAQRVGDMFPETRRILEKFYEPYNNRLAKLLNNDQFKWKNFYS